MRSSGVVGYRRVASPGTAVVPVRYSIRTLARVATSLEAILWHEGEAQPARDRVRALPPEDREALLDFIESL
ncbi:hypothetical protein GCM10009304_11550 [Pseudomonas matsuisoli]|uniref:Uncharacterized protein n=2 Tax=Pseudomonas matsuisoli TaxID=1515666 RepID=A0A917PQH6_9PSED|nr:hypothetical protein GCM10009304_11550 [Pseudomonas matsuisoli]